MAVGAQMSEKDSDQLHDREITLSTGKLLGIFFALAVLCGLFFAMGYTLGKNVNAGANTQITGNPVPVGNSAGKPAAGNKAQSQAQAPADNNPAASSAAKSSDSSATQPPADQSAQQPSDVKSATGGSFMVQVAAVSRQEDAEILKSALQKKQYPVFIANSAGDPLFHVQVGPFTDRKDAEAMKTRLAGDGYNAIVK